MRDLEGKVAFITGAGGGIGLGMAKAFLRGGMRVVAVDNMPQRLATAAKELAEFGARALLLQVDVTDRSALERAAAETVRVFGRVHVVCNNAGVVSSTPIETSTYADWDFVLGINLGGVINGLVSFLPRIIAQGEGGHIVNTSSMAGLIPLPATGGLYSTSKFAVRGLTDSLRLNLGHLGIGASVLCPGLTRSNMPPPPFADAGMDPVEVGERVLLGIRRNEPYILTHGEFREEVEEIFAEILTAFPVGQPLDRGRLAFEEGRRKTTAEGKAAAEALGARAAGSKAP